MDRTIQPTAVSTLDGIPIVQVSAGGWHSAAVSGMALLSLNIHCRSYRRWFDYILLVEISLC